MYGIWNPHDLDDHQFRQWDINEWMFYRWMTLGEAKFRVWQGQIINVAKKHDRFGIGYHPSSRQSGSRKPEKFNLVWV